ncbi:MAG: hypothetical protein PHO54_04105 [Candidatus Peribacteraceae bacterium]|nr:hypothetical protein [Candidatus Peribacteraceae bacterium]
MHPPRKEFCRHGDAQRTEDQKITFALRRAGETLQTITPEQWGDYAQQKGISEAAYRHAVWAKLFWQFYGNA